MRTGFKLIFVFILIFTISFGCAKNPEVMNENTKEEIQTGQTGDLVQMPGMGTRWKEVTHEDVASIAASSWGLSSARVAEIEKASTMPDLYQSKIDNGYNQQWSHAYIYNFLKVWEWGDADDDFHDNINGDSGELESPESYNKKWAGYYYQRGDQKKGDWFLGYAIHFIEDVNLVVHTSDPLFKPSIVTRHKDFEKWVQNNLNQGHNLISAVKNDSYYYRVTDLKAAVRTSAKNSSYWTSSLGKKVWSAYKKDNWPTKTGTGSSDLVKYTREMLRNAGRWAKGTIKYTLDKYGQWSNKY